MQPLETRLLCFVADLGLSDYLLTVEDVLPKPVKLM